MEFEAKHIRTLPEVKRPDKPSVGNRRLPVTERVPVIGRGTKKPK